MSAVPVAMEPASPVLTWRASWVRVLLRERPLRLAIAAALLVASVLAVVAVVHPFAGGVLLAALILSLDELLLPVSYRFDADRVHVRTLLRTRTHAWVEFTDVVPAAFGVLLVRPVRRSLHLLAPGREDVIAMAAAARVFAATERARADARETRETRETRAGV